MKKTLIHIIYFNYHRLAVRDHFKCKIVIGVVASVINSCVHFYYESTCKKNFENWFRLISSELS